MLGTVASVGVGVVSKVIEVAIPLVKGAVKEAGAISFKFIEGGINAVKDDGHEEVKLTKSLDIIDNDLRVPLTFSTNQFRKMNQEIKKDLDVIKGQNDILFLSNSINYFIESHMLRTGIDRGISYALQYDVHAVTNHIKKNQSLRFPGYLLHQCTALAETIKEYNLFYDSLLNNGLVREWSYDEAVEELEKTFGVHGSENVVKSYIPFDHQIPWKRGKASSQSDSNKNRAWINLFDSGGLEDVTDEAHDLLLVLLNELAANESLEYALSKRLETLPDKRLIIISPEV
jgi:hypothetical protein